MMNVWTGLLANMAVLTMTIALWSNLGPIRFKLPAPLPQFLFGVHMGIGLIALMVMRVPLTEGVFIDLRVALLTLAGFFGGPAAGLVAAAAGASYRIYVGGAGVVAGTLAIIIPALIGIAGQFLIRKRKRNWKHVLAVSCAGTIGGLLTLLVLPPVIRDHVVPIVTLPLGLLGLTATFLGGLAILNELNRRETLRSNLIYRQVIEAMPDCINVKDPRGRFIVANAATAKLMHAGSADELIGKSDAQFYPPDIAEKFLKDELDVLIRGVAQVIEQRAAHSDGTSVWLSTMKVPLFGEGNNPVGLITHNRDISDRKRLELQLAESQQHLTDALANMPDGLAMFDAEGIMIFCNEQYRNMFPRTAELRVAGSSYKTVLLAALQRGEFLTFPLSAQEALARSAQDILQSRDKTQLQLFDGRWIQSRTRFTIGGACFLVCSDITQIKDKEAELEALNGQLTLAANTDGLTGLANRRAFDDRLRQHMNLAARGGVQLSLLLIDVDRFKAYNDTYGHPAGDECLKRIAKCMGAIARRPSDLTARYGGEELAILMPLTPLNDAISLAQKLRSLIHDQAVPHTGSEKGIVTVSIGVATVNGHEACEIDDQSFLQRADQALYDAKTSGRDLVRHWSAPGRRTGTAGL